MLSYFINLIDNLANLQTNIIICGSYCKKSETTHFTWIKHLQVILYVEIYNSTIKISKKNKIYKFTILKL